MDPFKKLEGRIFNLELHILDIKYSDIGKEQCKGRLVDSLFISNNTHLTKQSILTAIRKNQLPVYFFEDDINRLISNNQNAPIPETSKELVNG